MSELKLAVPAPASTRPSTGHRADIQGMRAIGVLTVMAFHAGLPVAGGYVGVDIFFVISGFVIAAMLQREWATHGRIRFGRFYLRRFLRLTPALAVMVAVTMVAFLFVPLPQAAHDAGAWTGMAAVALGANYMIARQSGDYFGASAETNPLLHTWSLSVEEQFYLGFPLMLAVAWFVAHRRRAAWIPLLVVSLVALASFAAMVMGALGMAPERGEWLFEFYSPLTRAWEFAAGALVALLWDRLVIGRRLTLALSVAAVLLLGWALFGFTATTPFPSGLTLVPVMAAVALLLVGPSSLLGRMLSTRGMVRVGDWSYSLYLWHWPLIVAAAALWPEHPWVKVLALVATFVPAYLSYRYLETPLRALRVDSVGGFAKVAAALLIPAVLASGLLLVAARSQFWNAEVRAVRADAGPKHGGCHDLTKPLTDEGRAAECTQNADDGGQPVYLVGDSNAQHFVEGVALAAKGVGRPFVTSTGNSCPLVDVTVTNLAKPSATAPCRDFVDATLKYLSAAPEGDVIISNSDQYLTEDGFIVDGIDASGATALEEGLEATVVRLTEAGHRVTLVQTIPHWISTDDRREGCVFSALGAECPFALTVAEAESRQEVIRNVVEEVALKTSSRLLDPWTVLCRDGECAWQGPGFDRYRDATHITVRQSEDLAPFFESALSGAGAHR